MFLLPWLESLEEPVERASGYPRANSLITTPESVRISRRENKLDHIKIHVGPPRESRPRYDSLRKCTWTNGEKFFAPMAHVVRGAS